MRKKKCVAMLLAGGQGSRLGILTKKVAKPAVPFGGKFRIIDFPLSNCTNSGIDVVGVLTQYRPLELNAYIGCFNALDSKTHGSIQSYTRWIKDVDAGPTGRETHVYGPFEISDYDMKQCDAPVTEAMAAKPALADLDAAAGRYQQALNQRGIR